MAGALELRIGPGGLRHYLDGDPVHAGDALEIQMSDGNWSLVRYEANFHADRIRVLWTMLYAEPGTTMEPRTDDVLRWPEASTRPGRDELGPAELDPRCTVPTDKGPCGEPATDIDPSNEHGFVCEAHRHHG